MQALKIVLISLAGAILVGFLAGKIISNHLRKKRESSNKAVLSKKELLLSLVSVVLGVSLIVVGLVISKPSSEDFYGEGVFEEGAEGEEYQGEIGGGNDSFTSAGGSGGGVVVEEVRPMG